MSNPFPSSSVVWLAIDIYMKHAYDGPLPFAVKERLESLRQQAAETFYDCDAFEHDIHKPPTRFSLRLGNRQYPNMKLSIQSTVDGTSCFFKADTHDRHIVVPPKSPEYAKYLAMTEANEILSKKIEAEWSAVGVPTFREFLREDLARRQAISAAQHGGG
jgi:hypothetical protein